MGKVGEGKFGPAELKRAEVVAFGERILVNVPGSGVVRVVLPNAFMDSAEFVDEAGHTRPATPKEMSAVADLLAKHKADGRVAISVAEPMKDLLLATATSLRERDWLKGRRSEDYRVVLKKKDLRCWSMDRLAALVPTHAADYLRSGSHFVSFADPKKQEKALVRIVVEPGKVPRFEHKQGIQELSGREATDVARIMAASLSGNKAPAELAQAMQNVVEMLTQYADNPRQYRHTNDGKGIVSRLRGVLGGR